MQVQKLLLPYPGAALNTYPEATSTNSSGAACSRSFRLPTRKRSPASNVSTTPVFQYVLTAPSAAAIFAASRSTPPVAIVSERLHGRHAPTLHLSRAPRFGVVPLVATQVVPLGRTFRRTRWQRLLGIAQWRPGHNGEPHGEDKAHTGGKEATSEDASTAAEAGGAGGLSTARVLEVSEAYVEAWWRGVARGTDVAAEALKQLVVSPTVEEADAVSGGSRGGLQFTLMPDGVLHRRPLRGYEALIGQLEAQHAEYHRVQYRPITSAAASPPSSSAYVLGEYRMQDVGGLAGHPATFRVSRGYCLFKLRVDSATGRVSMGWVRRQMTQEERDERVWDPVHVYPAPFPLEHLHLTRDSSPDPRVMQEAACAWVAAQAKRHEKQPKKEKQQQGSQPQGPQGLEAPSGPPGKAQGVAGFAEDAFGGERAAEVRAARLGDAATAAAAAVSTAADVLGAALAEAEEQGLPRGVGGADFERDSGGGGGSGVESISTAGVTTSISPELSSRGGGAGELLGTQPQRGGGGGSSSGGGGGGDTAAGLASASEEIGATADACGGGGGGGGDSGVAAAAAAATTTTTEAQRRLIDHVMAEGCRLLDAYGTWPLPEDDAVPYTPSYGNTYGGRRQQAVVGAKHVLERIQAEHKRCARVEPLLYDVAVSEEHNIAFVHWVNFITPEPEPEPVVTPPLAAVVQSKAAPPPPKHVRHQHHAHPQLSGPVADPAGVKASADVPVKVDRPAAVAASMAATAAATAASAAAHAATAAADVATTAANAATVAASTANTAATIAATAATAAAFAAGDIEERPAVPQPALPLAAAPTDNVVPAAPEFRDKNRSVTIGRQQQAGEPGLLESTGVEGGVAKAEAAPVDAGRVLEATMASAEGAANATSTAGGGAGGSGGPRTLGLQDLRIAIPPMPPMPQIQNQIQNLEEVLSAAAQRVAGAAGTAAAAASAAAAAAHAVIMAEAGGPGGAAGSSAGKETAGAKRSAPVAAAPPPAPRMQLPYHQDCMAALLFNDDGTVSDVWLFRGPYHFERRLLRP